MIDTYFDRCDAASGAWRTQRDHSLQSLYDDPRYFGGQLYATMIDRNVAEAKDRLASMLDRDLAIHRWEMNYGIKVGDWDSYFDKNGIRKVSK